MQQLWSNLKALKTHKTNFTVITIRVPLSEFAQCSEMIPVEVATDCKWGLKLLIRSIKAISLPITGSSVIIADNTMWEPKDSLIWDGWFFLFASGNKDCNSIRSIYFVSWMKIFWASVMFLFNVSRALSNVAILLAEAKAVRHAEMSFRCTNSLLRNP